MRKFYDFQHLKHNMERVANEVGRQLQQFIPVSRSKIKHALLENWQLDEDLNQKYQNLFKMFEVIWHHDMHHNLEELKSGYESMNPDSFSDIDYNSQDITSFLENLDETMVDGNWLRVSQEEIDEALEGEDILPISLDVRFDELRNMKLYRLGDTYREVEVKSWFGLKKETKKLRLFGHVLTVLEFKDEDWFMENRKRKKHYLGDEGKGLHIRLFKEVPHLDLEVIFPNTSPSMRTLEKIKIGAPLIGGLVSLGMKYGPVLFGNSSGDTSLSLIGGLLTAMGTYVLKTYTSYQKTREKFRSAVAKDMYFKGIANNESVLTYLIDMAEEQEVKEAICAYIFIQQSEVPLNEAELDEVIENWLLTKFGHDIDFEVDDALAKLQKMKLLNVADDGMLSVVSLEQALITLDDYWDNLYDFVE